MLFWWPPCLQSHLTAAVSKRDGRKKILISHIFNWCMETLKRFDCIFLFKITQKILMVALLWNPALYCIWIFMNSFCENFYWKFFFNSEVVMTKFSLHVIWFFLILLLYLLYLLYLLLTISNALNVLIIFSKSIWGSTLKMESLEFTLLPDIKNIEICHLFLGNTTEWLPLTMCLTIDMYTNNVLLVRDWCSTTCRLCRPWTGSNSTSLSMRSAALLQCLQRSP